MAYFQGAPSAPIYNVTVQTNTMTVVIFSSEGNTTLTGPFTGFPDTSYVEGVVGPASTNVRCRVEHDGYPVLGGRSVLLLCDVPGVAGTQAISARLWSPTAPPAAFAGDGYSATCICTGSEVCNPLFTEASYTASLSNNLLTLSSAASTSITIMGYTNALIGASTTTGVFLDGILSSPVNTTLSPVVATLPSSLLRGTFTSANGQFVISVSSAYGPPACTLTLVKSAAAALQMSVFVIAAVATTIFATVF